MHPVGGIGKTKNNKRWYIPINLKLTQWGQEDHELKVILDHMMTLKPIWGTQDPFNKGRGKEKEIKTKRAEGGGRGRGKE